MLVSHCCPVKPGVQDIVGAVVEPGAGIVAKATVAVGTDMFPVVGEITDVKEGEET